jgi:hypothetical protein
MHARVRPRSRGVLLSASALALALVLASCGGDDEPASDGGDNPTDTANTAGVTMLNGQWPLTGEKLDGDLPDHPVYVVKIDNTSSSAPQVGLDKADLVVEELVEGGLTRMAVFYYSEIPDNVGPVRSMRASDIGIVKPARATVVASGASPQTGRRLAASDITTVTEGATGFYRNPDRSAPYNLFMHLDRLAENPGKSWQPPKKPYMTFGDPSDLPGSGATVRSIKATFSGGQTTDWKLTDKGWSRPGSYAQQGQDFVPDNVLLLRVKVGDAGYLDPAGNPVPETSFSGTGSGFLVHGDQAVKVTWHKKRAGPISLTAGGEEVPVPVGRTWIELIPRDTGAIALSKK